MRALRIVVIDDNEADADLIRRMLARSELLSVKLEHYLDYPSARSALEQDPPDCLLLDYRLGAMSGIEVLTRIRKGGSDVAVIAITGAGSEPVAVEALQNGAQDYLAKDAVTTRALDRSISNAVEKVALERCVREKQTELESFVSVVAHDLQQPLAAMKGNIELLQDFQTLDERGQRFASAAIEMATRMSDMISGLLNYARVGRSAASLVAVDLEQVVAHALSNLAAAITDKGAKISVGPLPVVLGDELSLIQLFQNLIGNALKFHRPGGPTVGIGADREGDRWTIQVEDNGIGIPPESLETIFEPFKRLHSRKDFPGSGIGLATCRRIVEQHEGRIWVESQPESGTRVQFALLDGARESSLGAERRENGILTTDKQPAPGARPTRDPPSVRHSSGGEATGLSHSQPPEQRASEPVRKTVRPSGRSRPGG